MVLEILYRHLAVILVFLTLAGVTWIYGGTRPEPLAATLPWLMALSLEGFLFPKTYPYNGESTADSIIRAMLDQYGAETAGLDWSYVESRGLSHYDAIKLASIVEKESNADHRATVASVFYNRLAVGMRLQSDATVAYIVGHDPTPDDINAYNDYNTYFIMGLPPTPINSPSLACMQAVCAPPETDYFYFYFEPDASGKMAYSFSATYEEHQQTYQ